MEKIHNTSFPERINLLNINANYDADVKNNNESTVLQSTLENGLFIAL